MSGNRSTGMRTRLVSPMTAAIRQTTMMKYGLRMEKPRHQRASFAPPPAARSSFGVTSAPGFQLRAVADDDQIARGAAR